MGEGGKKRGGETCWNDHNSCSATITHWFFFFFPLKSVDTQPKPTKSESDSK